MLQQLRQYEQIDWRDLGDSQLDELEAILTNTSPKDISSSEEGRFFIEQLSKYRHSIAKTTKRNGGNFLTLLNALLSVGEDGLYSNSLRFIFELIQNVDDCEFPSPDDCCLDMHFDFNNDVITLTYNEVGFTPYNVFAITGIAEAAKNVSSSSNEIGEKGIGFKSVFGVANKVRITSGWFSFELFKDNFTIPVPAYDSFEYCSGTKMTLYVPGRAKDIYDEIKKQYCHKEALFSRNPLLFLNKLTSLRMHYDAYRCMEFHVSRSEIPVAEKFRIERDVIISVNLRNYDNQNDTQVDEEIRCTRYSYPVVFSRKACQSRYGENTQVGKPDGRRMILRVILPDPAYISEVGKGALYSFLPTQLKLTVPVVCHVPFKLDASREFVDPQDNNLWFQEASGFLSELIDFAYQDFCQVVKEDIVRYLPKEKENLFAVNNGKERCLSRQKSFAGSHYLTLPLFFTMDGTYHKAEEIFCFNQEEQITEPETVYRLMEYQRFLFITSASTIGLGIKTERNVRDNLFRRALSVPRITSEALDYLDRVDYAYSEKQLSNQDKLTLTPEQIEVIFRHRRLAALLKNVGCDCIKKNMRMKFSVSDADEQSLRDVLYEGFELSEAPKLVEQFMLYCREKCICLDIGDNEFLPCYNAICLSRKNPLSSFATFCGAIDENDIFAIRIKLRQASERLNHYIEEETGSASDYLRELRNIRLSIKDSLGNTGYKSYIQLILQSGTDRGRFIQELLQNADDCDYLPDVTPTFSLRFQGNTVLTEHNEVGFNRANIRSITAIGESTKNKLINGEYKAIGEKGVGFKMVFAVASEVKIRSGEYAFYLADREPTVPRILKDSGEPTPGTRMEFILKGQHSFPSLNEKSILELCLCLRKLRNIQIGNHTVSIEDTDGQRIITVNSKKYVFRRFTHSFTVKNEKAIKERENETRMISAEQTITCYVPERTNISDYPLYNGLPTKHRIKIPLVIDAPFALTTSREEIETESSAWNNIIREELYKAILNVMDTLKSLERERILRFTKFLPRFQGKVRVYINEISDCSFIASYDFLSALKNRKILPTFDKDVFEISQRQAAYRYPEAANIIFRSVPQTQYAGIQPSSVIDVVSEDHEAALNALGCVQASFAQVFKIIERHAERFIRSDEFRPKLYEFLLDCPPAFREQLKKLRIIPVYGELSETVDYIAWKENSIFVRKAAVTSSRDYYVLNEKLLPKADCEKIFDCNINEMNAEFERSRYNENLRRIINGDDMEEICYYLLREYNSGRLLRNRSFEVLYAASKPIPLINELGEVVDTTLFLCDQPAGYFPVEMIQRLIVHKDCEKFAKELRLRELCDIYYQDVDYYEPLTADDVEILMDDYFKHSDEILREFYMAGYLPDELITEYGLEYLDYGRDDDNSASYQFPSETVGDRSALRNHARKLWQSPVRIISEEVVRSVQKGMNKDGSKFDLSSKTAREGALRRYAPEGETKRCFCQMCKKVKRHGYIEVNNIEANPGYFFPELRISLCLECSKDFQALRSKEKIREAFIDAIKNAPIHNEGTVEIPIGREKSTITFTAKHLAEIQEILQQMPKKS